MVMAIISQAFSQNSKHIDEATARKTALAFLESRSKLQGVELQLVSSSEIYIFNFENQGFVIVSGNTVLPPILGYSFENPMPDLEYAPENLRDWIDHYGEMIVFATERGISPEAEIQRQWDDALQGMFPRQRTEIVSPLVSTRWDQGCYYNEYCPAAPGSGWWGGGPCGHVYAGCVACAMSQVMKYWNYPEVGNGSHSYIHENYGEQSANFGETTYHWEEMPNSVWSHNDAVATLMYHCGVSVNMNYDPSGSGAYSKDVETAVRSYFGYCGAKYLEKSKYSQEVWDNMLRAELDLSHPIYYSGNNSRGGHAFVCDGYDDMGGFNFNFGWSGSGDGFYSTYDVNSYNQGQAAVMNFIPMDIQADENGIIHVSADGQGNGSSWENATPLLEFATFLSSGNDVQVWVKKGTYYGDDSDPENAFRVSGNNRVYGGFNGDEGPDFNLDDRDLVNNATILDGRNTKRVLMQDGTLTVGTRAVWDGFVLQNGNAGAGAGAYINGFTTLSNCVIRNNQTETFGGGVYINSNNYANQVFLTNCEITGNTASLGGGICERNSSVITNCVISNNVANTKGGGIYTYNNAEPILKGCVISNNTAENAGGIYARGKCTLYNCNIVMNKSTASFGGTFNENTQSKYYSCILWGNEAYGFPNQNAGLCEFKYCAVQGGINGEGNINLPAENDGEEPGGFVRFVSPAQGTGAEFTEANWAIQSRSICLNAGKPETVDFNTDIDGNQRVQHGRIDIGAYERNASLTLKEASINAGESYWFHDRNLYEPGYYTTIYPTPTCDSVVGLTLQILLDVEEQNTVKEVVSVEVYSLLGQHMGTASKEQDVYEMNLRPGCYLLRVQTTAGLESKKVIIRN